VTEISYNNYTWRSGSAQTHRGAYDAPQTPQSAWRVSSPRVPNCTIMVAHRNRGS